MSLAGSAWIPLWLDPPQSKAWFGTSCLSLLTQERPSLYCTRQTLLSHWCAALEACTLSGKWLTAQTAIGYHLSDGSGFLSWPLLLVKAHWSGPVRVPFPWEKSLICLQVNAGTSHFPVSLKVVTQRIFFRCNAFHLVNITPHGYEVPFKIYISLINKYTCTLFGIDPGLKKSSLDSAHFLSLLSGRKGRI